MMELSGHELMSLIEQAESIKTGNLDVSDKLKRKHLALIFQRPSTRTKVSFEVAISHLGGNSISLGWQQMQLDRGETISDTAKTLERYVCGVIARVVNHKHLEELATHSTIPVLNALSNMYHPCQALGDMLTLYEEKGKLKGIKLAWVGDGNNVCHSLLLACSKLGVNMTAATPQTYAPSVEIVQEAQKLAQESGAKIAITTNPQEAAEGADALYTDTFISMGHEPEMEDRMRVFLPKFQVNSELLAKSKSDCVFMHCLPAHREYEVTGDVIDGVSSIVWKQVENRLHAQKSLLAAIF